MKYQSYRGYLLIFDVSSADKLRNILKRREIFYGQCKYYWCRKYGNKGTAAD
jgi:hypothetical protein